MLSNLLLCFLIKILVKFLCHTVLDLGINVRIEQICPVCIVCAYVMCVLTCGMHACTRMMYICDIHACAPVVYMHGYMYIICAVHACACVVYIH